MKEGEVRRRTMAVRCSIIIVNFNGEAWLKKCLDSLKRQSYRGSPVEILVVDNGSSDGSVELVRRQYPDVAVLTHAENNYAKALNLGISRSKGEFIAFLNNDMVVAEAWLAGLVELLESDERIGCVGGKLFLMDGRINSVGIEQIEGFYFRDQGFGEEDRGQYDHIASHEAITGGAILWRRECLEDIGAVDEDYLMYLEDVDLCFRCKAKGWLIMYTPYSTGHHWFHGSSAGTDLCYYFCNRNRFLFLARHFPDQLPGGVLTSHFYKNNHLQWLYESMPPAMEKVYKHHPRQALESVLPQMRIVLTKIFGREKIDALYSWMELVLSLRHQRVGICGHELHVPGGRACAVVQFLQAIETREEQINELQEEVLHQKNELVGHQNELIGHLQAELQFVHSSLGWKAVTLYWRLKDVCLPPSTRRRKLYDRILANFKNGD
jgi:GT2 family glycosyltransferase